MRMRRKEKAKGRGGRGSTGDVVGGGGEGRWETSGEEGIV